MNLGEALSRALASIDLPGRVRRALLARPAAEERPARVLAIGKASGAMVDGAVNAWRDSLRGGIVVLPDGAPAPRDEARFQIFRASHPLPDERSALAGEAALSASTNPAAGSALALVSGGASSLAFLPLVRSSLPEARAAMAALLASGATVRDINLVRRHASRAHGGALAAPGILTILASDVIGGLPHDVGSGPTVRDPTTRADAERVLTRFAPAHAALPLRETVKSPQGDPRFLHPPVLIVEPGDLAAAFSRELSSAGLAVRILPASTADAVTLSRDYIALATALGPGEAVVRSAESAVTLEAHSAGSGGRCAHLAALVARGLPPGVSFLAAASDGVDGSSGTAGAIVTGESFPDRTALDVAIAAFDTGPLHLSCGTALPCAPTGLNLTDVHALVREGDRR